MSIEALGDTPVHLPWAASSIEHAGGSAAAMWRVRRLDFGEHAGEIRTDQAEFRYVLD